MNPSGPTPEPTFDFGSGKILEEKKKKKLILNVLFYIPQLYASELTPYPLSKIQVFCLCLVARVQPRWIQVIRRGDGFGDQDTIELKIKEWLNKYSSVRKYSGEKRLNNLAYVKS